MRSIEAIPTLIRSALVCAATLLLLHACGGGGGGGGGSGSNGGGGPPPGASATIPPSGQPTVVVGTGGSIVDAVRSAAPGTSVIIAPGVYGPFSLTAADVPGALTILADTTGVLTNSPPSAVIIEAHGASSTAILLTGIPEGKAVVLDGLTVRDATQAGIVVDGSPGTTVRNCTVKANPGDGVLLRNSDRILVFNNLVLGNTGAGIRALGSSDLRIFNNTIYKNAAAGIAIGATDAPSNDAVAENNIVNSNTPVGMAVSADSLAGYDGDFNLNTDGYAAGTPAGVHDLHNGLLADPQFVPPGTQEFFLAPSSPAIDAGDPGTEGDLAAVLEQLSTQSDFTADTAPVDMGYHHSGTRAASTPTKPPVAKSPTKPRGSVTPTRPAATPTRPPGTVAPTPTPTKRLLTPTRTRPAG